jgi:hypothetical protein
MDTEHRRMNAAPSHFVHAINGLEIPRRIAGHPERDCAR